MAYISNSNNNVTLNLTATDTLAINSGNNVLINGTAADDSIRNSGEYVTIEAFGGNDTITNWDSSNVTINGGASNDSIGNGGTNVAIDGGAGNDTIDNRASNVTINGGADNDSIYSGSDSSNNNSTNVTINADEGDDEVLNGAWSENSLINGGLGNDTVYYYGKKTTINGGAGDDYIEGFGSDALFNYTNGDGNDTIYSYKFISKTEKAYSDNYSLQINSASPWSSVTVGNDIVVTVGDGSITLVDAASLYGGGTDSVTPDPTPTPTPVTLPPDTSVTPVNPAAPTDVIFIIDKSRSMSDKIQKVKDAIISFANSLENSNADFRFGVVVFDGPDEIIPYTFTAADGTSSYFTNNITDFTTVVNTITDDGHSGSEYGLTAIQTALLTGLREGVSRRFVVLTDEGYGENSSDYVTSTDIETALKAANVKMDVVGRMGTDCQTEYEPLANSTGGKFYDIDSLSYYNYFEEIADDILGRAHVNINLDIDSVPEGTTSGVFVVTPTVNAAGAIVPASSDSTFKAAAEEGDSVVGYVVGEKAYLADPNSPWRQIVTVPDNWIVSGTYQDDALNVTGSNAVISGSLGKDNISINEDAVNTTIVDVSELQNGSDTLSFSKRVTPGTLRQNFTGTGVALYTTDSDGALDFVINLQGIAALDESLLNCEVSNAGKPNTIRELIYGEGSQPIVAPPQPLILNDTLMGRIMFAQWGYGFTPTEDNPLFAAMVATGAASATDTSITTDTTLATSADLAFDFGSPTLDDIAPANFAVTQDDFTAQNFNAEFSVKQAYKPLAASKAKFC